MPEKQVVGQLEKTFDPAHFEERWYSRWEKDGRFQPQGPAGSPRFVMVIPPPNVTGRLHIGHAYGRTVEDILARWKRMRGHRVLWVPGHRPRRHRDADGRRARSSRRRASGARDLGREKFVERVWAWRRESGDMILAQLRKLGCSLDWSRLRFTMDPDLSRAVRHAFVRLYRGRPDLPGPLRRELVPALRDRRLGPRGRAPRDERDALQDPLRRRRRARRGRRRDDAARDDARRHGPRDPPRRPAHGGAARADGDPADRGPRDPDHRGPDPRRSRVRHRHRQGHARARRQRLRLGPAPRSAVGRRHRRRTER